MSRLKIILFAALFGLIVSIVVYAASQTILYWPFLKIQNRIDDTNFLIRQRIRAAETADTDGIVIVDIDDRTFRALGNFKSKLWPRRHMAQVIGNIGRDGPRLIFLDIIFEGRTIHNADLADSIKSAGNVIAGYYFRLDSENKERRPLDSVYNELFYTNGMETAKSERAQLIQAQDSVFPYDGIMRSVRALGFTNYIPDPDGILRHIPLYIGTGIRSGRASASVAVQMWLQLNGIHYSQAKISRSGVRFGDTFIPTDKHCFMRLNFKALGPIYPSVSFVDVFRGDFEPGFFRDKIVMIGSSTEKAGDIKRIPGRGLLPGVEVHATALSTLIDQSFLTVLHANFVFLLTVMAGIVAAIIYTVSPAARVGLPSALFMSAVLYSAGVVSFVAFGILINVVVPVFSVILLYVIAVIHRIIEHYEHHHVNVNRDVTADT